MAITLLGTPLVVPVSFDESKQTIALKDGRILALRSSESNGIRVYTPTGELLNTVSVNANNQGISAMQIAALADGGFVVSGATGVNIAFRIYNADLTERTNGPVAIAQPGFFNGGNNYGHGLEATPNGGFVVAWNTNKDSLPGSSPVGIQNGTPFFQGGSGPIGTSVDIRGSIYNGSGQLTSASGFLITEGDIQYPTYTAYSRFGDQYLHDIDVTASGQIITTYYGDRWTAPTIFPGVTGFVKYDSFRVIDGVTGAAIVGETPYNATTPIGPERSNNYYGPSQTVVLSNGLIGGIYVIDTEVSGANQFQIKFQKMESNGLPNGIEIDLALAFSSSHYDPQIRAIGTDSGGFLLVYRTAQVPADIITPAKYDFYVREYNSEAIVVQTLRLNTDNGAERIESVERGPDGTFMVTTWNSTVSPQTSITYILSLTGANDQVSNGGTTAETLNATGTGVSYLYSGGGADTINGGDGTNYLYGGSGDSVFNGGSGINVVRGGTGNELIRGGARGDTLDAGAGDDRAFGLAGADNLSGRAGTDLLIGDGQLSLTSEAQSIRRLYIATLDRSPDDGGWQGWTTAREGGQALTDIAGGFVGSNEFQTKYGTLNNTQFVQQLYRNVLDREADQGGLAAFVGALDSNAQTRTQVVVNFSESAEFINGTTPSLHAGQIYRLFGATLARAPDAIGFEGWTDAMGGGRGLVDIAGGFVGSTEFQATYGALDNTAFVTLLYQNVLGRAPDTGGLAGWKNVLDTGAQTRTQVVTGFSESGEYINSTRAATDAYMRNMMTSWNDTLVGGPGNDKLTGGRGSDRFEFTASEGGNDVIYGFESFDTLVLRGFGFANSAAALAAMAQEGNSVVLNYTGGSITFADTQLGLLQSLNAQGWVLG